MNWAAISTVTVLLFLCGVSLQTTWQVDGVLQQVGSRLEIAVFLEPDVPATALKSTLEQFPEVAAVNVISREQAWEDLLADLGTTDIAAATDGLGQNPLVDELKVRTKAAATVPQLAPKLAQLRGVDGVEYLDAAFRQLAQLSQGFSFASLIVVGLLTLTSISVITTTIRLIVVARVQEIEVMQLVGATNRWIYFPFLLQGMLFGVSGAVIAWGFMAITRQSMQTLLTQQPSFLQALAAGLQLSPLQLWLLPLILVGFGSGVGLMGSLLAVRRIVMRS